MLVTGKKAIREFGKKHAQARKPPARFLEAVEAAQWRHMPDLKATLPATDFDSASQTFIFDIAGNRYRLLAALDFELQTVNVESVMTHAEYTKSL